MMHGSAGVNTRGKFAGSVLRSQTLLIAALSPDRWDIRSWCASWRVRDVLGHLVSMAEATRLSMFWQIIRNPSRPDRAVDRMARALGGQPVPEFINVSAALLTGASMWLGYR